MKAKNDNAMNSSRRRAIKSLVGAAAVTGATAARPERWFQPLIETVVLPAHAQASVLMFGGAGLAVAAVGSLDDGTRVAKWMSRMLDSVVPVAEAGPEAATICSTLNGNLLTITFQGSNNTGMRQGTLNIDGTPGPIPMLSNACDQSKSFDAYVSGFNSAAGFTLNVTNSTTPFSVYVPLVANCPNFAPLDCT
jgi:hypothetical protein